MIYINIIYVTYHIYILAWLDINYLTTLIINSKVIAVIDIGKDKRLINGLEVKIDNLADELINLGTKKDIQIFLRPSEDLPVQDMIDVFDELSLENFQTIYILEP